MRRAEASWLWRHRIVLAVLLAAVSLRLYFALATPLQWDEYNDWLVIARSISLDPDNMRLPVHEGQHPSLPAYFIRAGTLVLGDHALGYRASGVLAGVATVALVYVFGRKWFGEPAALTAAALLAFNEYHIGISAYATEKPFYLLFALAAAYFFCEFVTGARVRFAVLASCALGLGVLCKYLTTLLIPVFGVGILVMRNRPRFQTRALYLSALTFLIVTAPDILWNLSHATADGSAANIADHMQRIGGLGFSRQPLVFYLRDLRNAIYPMLGIPFGDPAREYLSMNPIFGASLLGGMVSLTAVYLLKWSRARRETHLADGADSVVRLLGVWFWMVFGFFSIIRPGSPREGLDAVVWFWSDSALLPAVLVVGRAVPSLDKWPRRIASAILAAGGLLAVLHIAYGYE